MSSDLCHAGRHVSADAAALARDAANWIADRLASRSGILAVALSGGSTPHPVYELLASPPLRERMPWSRLHWFWGDERFVPQDHPDSNYRMARVAMLARVPVPAGNVHAVPTSGAPEAAAAAYERELRNFGAMRGEGPLFDLVLLGVGPDGHTASLFPGSAALQERERWALAVTHPPGERITLTLPALAQSQAVAFIAAGGEKRGPLTRIFAGARDLPAAQVTTAGEVHCFLDRAAAP